MSTENSSKPEPTQIHGTAIVPLPRVTIRFCVQCKWNLRAAYYAQELLQTFSLSLGEIALVPSTSGTFVVTLLLPTDQSDDSVAKTREVVLWDRKTEGGFPETKELKRRVRDLVVPGRELGHVDRDYKTQHKDGVKGGKEGENGAEGTLKEVVGNLMGRECEDCV